MDEIALLRAVMPTTTPGAVAESTRARAALMAHIATVTAPARRWPQLAGRRFRSPLALALVGMILLGGLSVMAAGVYFGEWGPVDHPATKAEIAAEISTTIARTPLPPGATYPIAAITARAEPAGNLTRLAGIQQVQFFAMCSWTDAWLAANRSGDPASLAAATATIRQFPTWQAVADPRLADDSIRTQIAAVVAAAARGDSGPIEGLYAGMTCGAILGR